MRLSLLPTFAILCVGATVQATTIKFTATDLPDTAPGQDLWRYDYTVEGRAFAQSEFFDILSAPSLFANLSVVSGGSPDWDAAILQQPNPNNIQPFDTGIFDAFALAVNPSLETNFSVQFVYLGSGRPGSQRFNIYDANSSLVETGLTQPAPEPANVPEPSSAVLCLLGIAAIGVRLFSPNFVSRRIY